MKVLIPSDPQESVRTPLETFGKGIVSYIPFKFAFKNLANTALCQKLPTAYFIAERDSIIGAKIRHWRKNSPTCSQSQSNPNFALVHFCTIGAFLHQRELLQPQTIADQQK